MVTHDSRPTPQNDARPGVPSLPNLHAFAPDAHSCCHQAAMSMMEGTRHTRCGPLDSMDDTLPGCESDEDLESTRRQVSESTEGGSTEAEMATCHATSHPDWEGVDAIHDIMAVHHQDGPPRPQVRRSISLWTREPLRW